MRRASGRVAGSSPELILVRQSDPKATARRFACGVMLSQANAMRFRAGSFKLVWAQTGKAETNQLPSFDQKTIPTGKGPRFIAVADLNHDHKPDLIVANAESGTLTILLGDGRGDFVASKASPILAGHLPNDIAVADMNRDGNLDLVIANHQSPLPHHSARRWSRRFSSRARLAFRCPFAASSARSRCRRF
ncbi:MAG TPA: VCBS repeat-containing protein [Chthoniobacterales bacterium]